MQISIIPKSGRRCLHISLVGWRFKLAIALVVLLAMGLLRLGFGIATSDTSSNSAVLSWWNLGREEAVTRELGALRAKIDLLESTLSAMEGDIPKSSKDSSPRPLAPAVAPAKGEPAKVQPAAAEAMQADVPGQIESLQHRMHKINLSLERVMSHRESLAINLIMGDAVLPIHARQTSGFGRRMDPFDGNPAFHRGIDFLAPAGTPVFALSAGVVEWIGPLGGYGNAVVVRHNDRITSLYAHLEGIEVTTGMAILTGNRIARVGSTGRSTGNHLHFEIEIDGRVVNPRPILDRIRARTITAMAPQ
jgi:murein DD-endopeptidase MepM/ murein hydrolase activator NlpD